MIAFDAATDGGNNGGTTNSHTFSHTCSGSNKVLIVGFAGDIAGGNDDITSVTYGGEAMTLVEKKVSFASSARMNYVYIKINPLSGANDVVINCTNNHYLIPVASSYNGAKQTGQPDETEIQEFSAFATNETTTLTPIADDCWVILLEQNYDADQPPGAGAGATRREYDHVFGVVGIFDSNSAVDGGVGYSMTTTRSGAQSGHGSHIMLSLAPHVDEVAGKPFFTQLGAQRLN